jgi:hypothetical protein
MQYLIIVTLIFRKTKDDLCHDGTIGTDLHGER